MKKYILDLKISENIRLNENFFLLKVRHQDKLPEIIPGQFAELRIDDTPTVMLRRPISINYVDYTKHEIWFLVQVVGDGTRKLANLKENETLNSILPLGNGFSLPKTNKAKVLAVGGGAGIAPLLFLGERLFKEGYEVGFLLGAKQKDALFQLDLFSQYGKVFITTEDGSLGEKGYVTNHPILKTQKFDQIYCCGPKPMMLNIAKYAKNNEISCEVSLENKMACGIGACLCCVEDTHEGNICVCTEGPVFNIDRLLWQI